MAENFLLLHGAYHGAWCWAAVSRKLVEMGHRVLAIDLPGHGASRFDRARANLDLYADALVDVIEREGFSDLVLTGHSMAGAVLTLAAPRVAARLKRLIFVNAAVLRDGERLADYIPKERRPLIEQAMATPDRCIAISDAFKERFRATFIQDASRDLQDFVLAALSPQPAATYLSPIANAPFFSLDLPMSWVVLEDDLALDPLRWHPLFSSRLKNPSIRSIKSGHEVMFTKPVELAHALDELARGL